MRWRVDWHPSPLSSVLRHVRQIITQRSVQSPSHKVRVIYLLGYISRSARNTCRRWRSGVPEGGRNCAGRKNKRCNILRRTVLVVQQIDEPVEPRGSSYSVLHGSAQNNRRPNSAEEVRYRLSPGDGPEYSTVIDLFVSVLYFGHSRMLYCFHSSSWARQGANNREYIVYNKPSKWKLSKWNDETRNRIQARSKRIIQTQNRTLGIIPLGKSSRYDFPKLWVSGNHSWSDFVGEKIPP